VAVYSDFQSVVAEYIVHHLLCRKAIAPAGPQVTVIVGWSGWTELDDEIGVHQDWASYERATKGCAAVLGGFGLNTVDHVLTRMPIIISRAQS
jgi:hypothetical protein